MPRIGHSPAAGYHHLSQVGQSRFSGTAVCCLKASKGCCPLQVYLLWQTETAEAWYSPRPQQAPQAVLVLQLDKHALKKVQAYRPGLDVYPGACCAHVMLACTAHDSMKPIASR